MNTYQIRQADWQQTQDQNALRHLRLRVFVEEQQVPEQDEWDDNDALSIHVLATDTATQTPCGCARLLPCGQIGRVAVLPQWRRQGIGTALIQHLLSIAQQQQIDVYLHAQTSSFSFYTKLGFCAYGDVFYEVNIPHQLMKQSSN